MTQEEADVQQLAASDAAEDGALPAALVGVQSAGRGGGQASAAQLTLQRLTAVLVAYQRLLPEVMLDSNFEATKQLPAVRPNPTRNPGPEPVLESVI